jgi:NADPH:quinone reductase-like Zn-dependent oxidoreductase
MPAVVMRSYGGPEVLQIQDVPSPAPILTEVLVRVRAAGTNPVDTYVRSGAFPLVTPPGIIGWDLSGVVEKIFPGVTRFRVRTAKVLARFTEAEHERLSAAAERDGVSLAELVAARALAAADD